MVRTGWIPGVILGAFACFGTAVAAELATKTALTLDVAKVLSAAAEAEAAKNNWSVVIAIVDDGGKLLHLVRRDGTQIASVDVAQGKARSAVGFKRPTKALEDAIAGGRTVMLGIEGLTPVQGGLPLVVNGETIGAVGVSGVTSQQDEQVASAAVAALAQFVKKK
jgi:glc operon protein GlcG